MSLLVILQLFSVRVKAAVEEYLTAALHDKLGHCYMYMCVCICVCVRVCLWTNTYLYRE